MKKQVNHTILGLRRYSQQEKSDEVEDGDWKPGMLSDQKYRSDLYDPNDDSAPKKRRKRPDQLSDHRLASYQQDHSNSSALISGNSQDFKSVVKQKSNSFFNKSVHSANKSAKSRKSSYQSFAIDVDEDVSVELNSPNAKPNGKSTARLSSNPKNQPLHQLSQSERKPKQTIDLETQEIPVDEPNKKLLESQKNSKFLTDSKVSMTPVVPKTSAIDNHVSGFQSPTIVQRKAAAQLVVQQQNEPGSIKNTSGKAVIDQLQNAATKNLLEMAPIPKRTNSNQPSSPIAAGQNVKQLNVKSPVQNQSAAQSVSNKVLKDQSVHKSNVSPERPISKAIFAAQQVNYFNQKPPQQNEHQKFVEYFQVNKNQFVDADALQQKIILIASKKGLENLTKTSCAETAFAVMGIMQNILTQLIQTSRDSRALAQVCNQRTFTEGQIKRVSAAVFSEDKSVANERMMNSGAGELPSLQVDNHQIDLICHRNTFQEIKLLNEHEASFDNQHFQNDQFGFNTKCLKPQVEASMPNQWQVQQSETMQALIFGNKKSRKMQKLKNNQDQDQSYPRRQDQLQHTNEQQLSVMETVFGGFDVQPPPLQSSNQYFSPIPEVPLTAMRSKQVYLDKNDASLDYMYDRKITAKDLQVWARRGASIREAQSLASGCQSARLSHKLNQILSLNFL